MRVLPLRPQGLPSLRQDGPVGRRGIGRIVVTRGLAALAAPAGLEAKALARIDAPPGLRLACQIRPSADLTIMPLLNPDATPAEGRVRGGLEGSERLITVVRSEEHTSELQSQSNLVCRL